MDLKIETDLKVGDIYVFGYDIEVFNSNKAYSRYRILMDLDHNRLFLRSDLNKGLVDNEWVIEGAVIYPWT